MGKITDESFKNWQDTEIIHATEYKQEREMLRIAVNDNNDRISSLEQSTAGILLGTAQLQKITSDSGTTKISVTTETGDILQELVKAGVGYHTFFAITNSKNMPPGKRSIRGFAHITGISPTYGYVHATDYNNDTFTNYVDNGKWLGWKRLVTAEEIPETTAWTKLQLGTGLTNYAPGYELSYRKIGEVVYIRGAISGDLDWGETVATLPYGFRPEISYECVMPTSTYTGKDSRFARWTIQSGGKIIFVSTNDGIIGTSDWYPLNVSFSV